MRHVKYGDLKWSDTSRDVQEVVTGIPLRKTPRRVRPDAGEGGFTRDETKAAAFRGEKCIAEKKTPAKHGVFSYRNSGRTDGMDSPGSPVFSERFSNNAGCAGSSDLYGFFRQLHDIRFYRTGVRRFHPRHSPCGRFSFLPHRYVSRDRH